MKKILIIDESEKFRSYLSAKFEEQGLEVIVAHNGLDGSIKLRSELPDLIVMDFFLTRKSAQEILIEKKKNPNTTQTPVILISSRIDPGNVMELASYGVKKIFSKPIKIDSIFSAVSKLLGVEITLDKTPCIIEAHINEDILFIEAAQGLNTEKIGLLKYKIPELLDIHEIKSPKALIMLSNIAESIDNEPKLQLLFETILAVIRSSHRYIKVLTQDKSIAQFIRYHKSFNDIEVIDNIEKAMDALLGLKPDQIAHDVFTHEKLLSSSAPVKSSKESIQMRFEEEKVSEYAAYSEKELIAIVDDDFIIRELIKAAFEESPWTVQDFADGPAFLQEASAKKFALVFLDLKMPVMNGFQVLAEMKKRKIDIPVVVFSALSQKETVIKAMQAGVRSYMIKPIKPEKLVKKTAELLRGEF